MKHYLVIDSNNAWQAVEYDDLKEAWASHAVAITTFAALGSSARAQVFSAASLDVVKRLNPNWFTGKDVSA